MMLEFGCVKIPCIVFSILLPKSSLNCLLNQREASLLGVHRAHRRRAEMLR